MNKLKTALIGAILSLGAVSAEAYQDTLDVNFSSCTTMIVNVSSTSAAPAATALFSASLVGATTVFTTLQEDRDALFIQNLQIAGSTTVFCAVGLSSTSANGDLALTQPAVLSTSQGIAFQASEGAKRLPIAPRNNAGRVLIPWCVNNGATGTTKVGVTQCRRKD